MRVKIVILFFSVLFSFSSFALASDQVQNRNQKALSAIDSVCVDTWCEGDYNYRFPRLKCNFRKQTCTLFYSAGLHPDEGQEQKWTRSGTCKISAVRSYDDILDSNTGNDLTASSYDQITECLNGQERG